MPRSISDASVKVFQCVSIRRVSSARERSAVGKTAINPVASACSRQPEMRRNCSPVPLPPWNMKTSGRRRARARPARDVDDELPRMAVHFHHAAVDARPRRGSRPGRGRGRPPSARGRRGRPRPGRGRPGRRRAPRRQRPGRAVSGVSPRPWPAATSARARSRRAAGWTTCVGHGGLPASGSPGRSPPGQEVRSRAGRRRAGGRAARPSPSRSRDQRCELDVERRVVDVELRSGGQHAPPDADGVRAGADALDPLVRARSGRLVLAVERLEPLCRPGSWAAVDDRLARSRSRARRSRRRPPPP